MTATVAVPYVLGVSQPEVRRLVEQSEVYAAATEDGLRRAGVGAGMHVLDVGAGAGGVSLLVARLVGPGGSVTALDVAPEMLEVTKARAAMSGLPNVAVMQADLATFAAERRYDAVVGRLILIHLGDPVSALRRLAAAVRPGGLVAFSEYAMSIGGQRPPGKLFTATLDRVLETFRGAGRPIDLGLELPRLFRAAGLAEPASQVGAPLGEPRDAAIYQLLASTSATLLPLSERLGVVAPGEVDQATLEQRLAAEAASTDAVTVPPLLVTTWARVAAA